METVEKLFTNFIELALDKIKFFIINGINS